MNVPDIIIAVDGFSATGKSTFAKMVAKEFDFLYLDSGAMYRGVTLYAMENGMIAEDGAIDEKALKAVIKSLDLYFRNGFNYASEFLDGDVLAYTRMNNVVYYLSHAGASVRLMEYDPAVQSTARTMSRPAYSPAAAAAVRALM